MPSTEHDKLLRYALAGDRPIKSVIDEHGHLVVLGWDFARRIFVPAPEHFMDLMAPQGRDVELLDEAAFEERVDDLLFA